MFISPASESVGKFDEVRKMEVVTDIDSFKVHYGSGNQIDEHTWLTLSLGWL